MYELLREQGYVCFCRGLRVTIAVARGGENVSFRSVRSAARGGDEAVKKNFGSREKQSGAKSRFRDSSFLDGFRTCDPTQAQGAMSSPRSGPAKQNLQLAVASQNLHVVSSSLAAASAASAASSTPVKDAVLLQQDLARPDGWSHSGKSSHSLECAARFLSAARVAPPPRNTAPRSIATLLRARSRASGASVRGHRRRTAASSLFASRKRVRRKRATLRARVGRARNASRDPRQSRLRARSVERCV